jgi:Uma2 family endonuclease
LRFYPNLHRRYDRFVKYNAYLKAGVKEYWIVDPVDLIVEVHILHDGSYKKMVYNSEGIIKVDVLADLEIHLMDIFPKAHI